MFVFCSEKEWIKLDFLKNFGKKKKKEDSGASQTQPMNAPQSPDAEGMLPSLSDEKLDGLDLPELPDLDDLGSPPAPKNPPANRPPAHQPPVHQPPIHQPPKQGNALPPLSGASPVPPMHKQITPRGPIQVANNEVRNMPPIPPGPAMPARKIPQKPMGVPKGFGNSLAGPRKPSSGMLMKHGPVHPANKKDESAHMLKKMDLFKGAGPNQHVESPFSGKHDGKSSLMHEGSSRMHAGDVFIKGEAYRSIMESINSVIALRNEPLSTSENLNFNQALNDKFEKSVEKVKDKILSVDEMLFE